jgi:hypothetical protein
LQWCRFWARTIEWKRKVLEYRLFGTLSFDGPSIVPWRFHDYLLIIPWWFLYGSMKVRWRFLHSCLKVVRWSSIVARRTIIISWRFLYGSMKILWWFYNGSLTVPWWSHECVLIVPWRFYDGPLMVFYGSLVVPFWFNIGSILVPWSLQILSLTWDFLQIFLSHNFGNLNCKHFPQTKLNNLSKTLPKSVKFLPPLKWHLFHIYGFILPFHIRTRYTYCKSFEKQKAVWKQNRFSLRRQLLIQ